MPELKSVNTKPPHVHNAVAVMDWAATAAAVLMDQIDECEEPKIPEALQCALADTQLELAEGVERVKALSAELKMQEQKLSAAIMALEQRREDILALKAALASQVKDVIEAKPGVQFRDSYGRKLSVGNNGGEPALKYDLETGRKHISHILSDEDLPKVPQEYVELVSFIVLNTDAVRAALESGVKLDWARLERGRRVYGL